MENTGMLQIILQGDLVTKFSAFLLLIMSIFTWSVLLYQFIYLNKLKQTMHKAIVSLWAADDFENGLKVICEKLPFLQAILKAIGAADHANVAQKTIQLKANLRLALQDTHHHLHFGQNTLATIASTSPFIGLLGTVWGIYHTLKTISGTGSVSMAQISGPVGEALIMTAFGLIVALPAVLAYNVLTYKSKQLYKTTQGICMDIENFLTGKN